MNAHSRNLGRGPMIYIRRNIVSAADGEDHSNESASDSAEVVDEYDKSGQELSYSRRLAQDDWREMWSPDLASPSSVYYSFHAGT